MKQEFDRAQERMTLKHKNTSKWAKKVLKRGLEKHDEGTRAAIAEQLHWNTLLSRKIHSVNESSSNDTPAPRAEQRGERRK
jgi:U3 small nucleolar RNA-associated protein 14